MIEWCRTEQVGIAATVTAPGREELSVLIEKDFRCIDPPAGEDQSDTFANPGDQNPGCVR
jgi:hypothetical protein